MHQCFAFWAVMITGLFVSAHAMISRDGVRNFTSPVDLVQTACYSMYSAVGLVLYPGLSACCGLDCFYKGSVRVSQDIYSVWEWHESRFDVWNFITTA